MIKVCVDNNIVAQQQRDAKAQGEKNSQRQKHRGAKAQRRKKAWG